MLYKCLKLCRSSWSGVYSQDCLLSFTPDALINQPVHILSCVKGSIHTRAHTHAHTHTHTHTRTHAHTHTPTTARNDRFHLIPQTYPVKLLHSNRHKTKLRQGCIQSHTRKLITVCWFHLGPHTHFCAVKLLQFTQLPIVVLGHLQTIRPRKAISRQYSLAAWMRGACLGSTPPSNSNAEPAETNFVYKMQLCSKSVPHAM